MAKSPYPVNLPNGVKDGDDAIAQSPDEGTLVVDKIGDMPLELQPKLLRALQERDDAQVAPAQQWRYDQNWRNICEVSYYVRDIALSVVRGYMSNRYQTRRPTFHRIGRFIRSAILVASVSRVSQ